VIPEGALVTKNEDKAVVGWLTGLGLNLAALPREHLYKLEDGDMMELHAKGEARGTGTQ